MVELKLIKYFLNLVLVKATILVYAHYNIFISFEISPYLWLCKKY